MNVPSPLVGSDAGGRGLTWVRGKSPRVLVYAVGYSLEAARAQVAGEVIVLPAAKGARQ
ncbi:hypothetical protein ACVWYH_006722 [Bradyrhizobium sp. GM24.11]|jgi:hypothetical protein